MPEKESAESQLSPQARSVYADILSQAVTGEIVGMQNFATLVGLCGDVESMVEALDHAETEKRHAVAFRSLAKELGVPVVLDLEAPYWGRLRQAFLKWAKAGDLTACILIQEVMLESFAVSIYGRVGSTAPGRLGRTFSGIAAEEATHLEHALELLQSERARDPASFESKVSSVHEDVMTILAQMVAKEDPQGHCGLCQHSCVKGSLPSVGLSIVELRGCALNLYLTTLDRIGLPGATSLQWVARLPL